MAFITKETVFTPGAGTYNLAFTNDQNYYVELSNGENWTVTFSNPPAAGFSTTVYLHVLTGTSAGTMTWSNVDAWVGAAPDAPDANARTSYKITYTDGKYIAEADRFQANTDTTYNEGTGLSIDTQASPYVFNVNVDAAVQNVAANSVTTSASRTYAVQVDGSDNLVVNVPWSDTNTTYTAATSSTLGLVKIGYTANAKNYPVQLSNDQMYVNVPWTDTDTDTNTTYTMSAVQSTNDVILRLTAGGSGSGNDDTKLIAGTNITLTEANGTELTIAAASTPPGGSNQQVQYNNSGSFAGNANFTFNSGTGEVTAIDFNSTSDENKKKNIKTLDRHNILEQLRPVSFTWKESEKDAFGLIAQEVEKILPEIVSENDDGIKSISYTQIIPFLIQEILELKKELARIK